MQAVILAAGKGTRMGRATDDWPKPMLRVGGSTILEHILANLPGEIDKIIFIVGYRGDIIKNYFGAEHQGRELTYVWQYHLDGSAGAIRRARRLLKGKFLVLNGDDLYHHDDLKRAVAHEFCLMVKETECPERFGVIELDEKGYLKKIIEKSDNPPSNLVNIGVYVLDKKFFDYEPVAISAKEYGLPQTIALMAADHEIKVEIANFWQPCNTPQDLKDAENILGLTKMNDANCSLDLLPDEQDKSKF
jgi:bifunctional UDP-N-acetylglucosamine pyrophosphorylase/glucosamine-1-phosphate N-acetyltransferase